MDGFFAVTHAQTGLRGRLFGEIVDFGVEVTRTFEPKKIIKVPSAETPVFRHGEERVAERNILTRNVASLRPETCH